MDYIIRDCKETDLDKLVILCEKHAAYERAAYLVEGKKERLQYALFSDNRQLNCLVVEVSGTIIGYATYTFDFSTWDAQKFIYLDCLYLEDEYRNYGIGAVLMDKVKQAGEANGCINMQWQTPDFNEKAIKFYKRIGGVGKEKMRFTLNLEQ
ncbi:GNAT family N-acetyltransferase [Flavobacterium psychrotrophum]|uniref:GNAT family N-acetyltransferase n=1 Tax=Flavobacterium psychrotrophum TaxID=2294119 RepID=UPI000E311687|nr:GNAT family N-acetyltransferase [Flavobacterium psychrotrophum]